MTIKTYQEIKDYVEEFNENNERVIEYSTLILDLCFFNGSVDFYTLSVLDRLQAEGLVC